MTAPRSARSARAARAAALAVAAVAVLTAAAAPAAAKPNTGQVYVYSDGALRTGALGTREATSEECKTIMKRQFPSVAKTCKKSFALLAYSTDGITSYADPTVYGTGVAFSADAGVYGPTNKLIAKSWTELWSGGLLETFKGAQAYAAKGVQGFWSGINNDGSIADNTCSDWSSSAPTVNGVAGDPTSTTSVFDDSTEQCSDSQANTLICLCVTGTAINPIKSTSPTVHPTHYHKTASPTVPTHHPTPPTPHPTARPTPHPTRNPTVPPIQRRVLRNNVVEVAA